MARVERQQAVRRVLEQLVEGAKGSEPLKHLFWTELNYQRANQPLSRRGWPNSVAQGLSEDPVLLASAGQDNEFHVLYARLASDRLLLGHERPVVSRLLKEHPYTLFIFSNRTQDRWHFLNVKYDGQAERRRIYRRITVGPEERLRTASERLARIDLEEISPDLFGLSPLAIQKAHDDAFDVEAVTKQFFDEYTGVFSILKDELNRQSKDLSWSHDYALQFLNRCMFLYFVQRKGWLGQDREFLRTFWEAYRSSSQPKNSFFERWLKVLFFEAFNNKFHGGYRHFPGPIQETLQLAPYLNGGLFTENELDNRFEFAIPDERFLQVFNFLERYNFTIAEDSPLDQEVAVDPEMIGKVYESLVNVSTEVDERGAAGIFYTPRTEIDLMCRLALVDWLTNHLGQQNKNLLYEVVFALEPEEKSAADHAASAARIWPDLAARLREITVLDPACGSGSFLVGMLHILDDLLARAAAAQGESEENPYERKKRIIGQSLYGVDVMEWAVHVAELRLWLTLIVDADFPLAELHARREPLLPHFTFKIRRGDSLVQEIAGVNLGHMHRTDGLSPALKARITRLKTEKLKFYNNDPACEWRTPRQATQEELRLFRDILDHRQHQINEELKKLRRKIEGPAERQVRLDGSVESHAHQMKLEAAELQKRVETLSGELEQITSVRGALRETKDIPFVWDIAFVEIFEGDKRGFDIVIGNPPYVRTQSIADPKLPKEEATPEQNKAYKAKLARSIYQAFPRFFGYRPKTNTVAHKLDGKSDLYVYFYFQGLALLNPQGSFCFITSNSWLDVGYGADLQEFLLKHCHVKMIVDNQARRSFATADVNTVIVLLSAPDETRDWGLSRTARFVMFKVPFEQILSAVVFEEIESVLNRRMTHEYRASFLNQQTLLRAGFETASKWDKKDDQGRDAPYSTAGPLIKVARYVGSKWGGTYLRAPDILVVLLEKGQQKLLPLARFASICTYLILPKKTDQVLILPTEEVPANISGFFLPFIRSPRYFDIPWIKQSPHAILSCTAADVARSKELQKFIRAAEDRLFAEFRVSPSRDDWYIVRQEPAPILCQRRFGERHIVFYNPKKFLSYDFYRLFPVSINVGHAEIRLAGVMMSTVFWLFKELFGRTNLGEGALKIEGTDLARMFVLDPSLLSADALSTCRSILSRGVMDLETELQRSDRRQLDEAVSEPLALSAGELDAVREAVSELVRNRTSKASSLSPVAL